MDYQKLLEKRVYSSGKVLRWMCPRGNPWMGTRAMYESRRARNSKRRIEKAARHGARCKLNKEVLQEQAEVELRKWTSN